MRALTLLLAVILMTGAAAQVCASPDVASAAVLDDAPDVDPVGPCALAVPLVVPRPDRQVRSTGCAPRSSPSGRMHAIVVFRPPRLVSSR